MRKTLSLCLYMMLVEVVAMYLVVVPVYAFQVSQSTTGYVRTLNASGASAMFSASRPAQLSAVASAASAGGASLAIRMVAGLGWVGLGVAAGLILYEMYYTPAELEAVKTAATPPVGLDIPGYTEPANSTVAACATCYFGTPGYQIQVSDPSPGVGCSGALFVTLTSPGPGWLGWGGWAGFDGCVNNHGPSGAGTPVSGTVVPATESQIATYIQNLPANDPLSVESNTAAVGVGGASQPAGTVLNQPVEATTVTTQVVPASQVQPTDVVVDPNATKPAGTVTNTTSTQTTTTTTTTVTNPDGSTTDTQEETAPVSCTSGNHELRTFGGILQDHMDLWKGSGLLSALNLLKTLTWPTTIPTYSLQSNLLGNFTLDFSAWSGMLTAIRSIIIAIAGFVAYRMIFVGAR